MASKRDITAHRVREELRALIRSGEAQQSKYAEKWAENPVGFVEDFNVKITETIEEFILAMIDPKIETLMAAGPRGGGKTLVVSIVGGAMFLFDEFDVLHMGGSETQAKYGFGYITNYYFSNSLFQSGYDTSFAMSAIGLRGNWYRIGACSETFVRGFHPGDPHNEMGNVEHGGLLIIDEEAVAKASVVEAAIPTVGDANPSKTVRLSTNHLETTTFAKAIEDPIGHGVDKVIEFDAFDISEKCKYSCARCEPNFAGKLSDRYVDWLADLGKQHRGADRPAGYCEGKAKNHKPGHKRIRRLRADFKKLGPEGFEKEYTRNKNKSVGKILPRAWLDNCLSGENSMIKPMPGRPTAFLADHAPLFTAYVVLQLQNDSRVAVLDVEHLINERSDDRIVAIALSMIKRNGCNFGFGDAAQEWMLSRISRESGVLIKPFRFTEFSKADSIGHTRRLAEETRLLIPGKRKGREYYFPKPSFRVFFEQCAGWHRDKNGKVVKKEDHYPDAVCTGAEAFFTGDYDSTAYFLSRDESSGLSAPPDAGFYDDFNDGEEGFPGGFFE